MFVYALDVVKKIGENEKENYLVLSSNVSLLLWGRTDYTCMYINDMYINEY